MKHCIVYFLILLSATTCYSEEKESKSWYEVFFSPLPTPSELARMRSGFRDGDDSSMVVQAIKKYKGLRPIVNLPAFKIIESSRENAEVDVEILTSVGAGISYQIMRPVKDKDRWYTTFSFSPLTALLSGNSSGDSALDLSLALTIGFFNNMFMVGIGYDLGVVSDRSRYFGLMSVGINFNN